MVSRADRSRFAEWWWTVDRLLLALVLILMFGGVVLSLAASPPVAERLRIDDGYFFVKRQALYLIPSILVLVGVSFLNPRQIRRLALAVFTISVAMMIATLFVGMEVKGARRWLSIFGVSVQASEFVKPAFVVLVAWLFAENGRRSDIPGSLFTILLLGIVASLLVAQPDFGQTMLIVLVWGLLFFLAGMSWLWIAGLGIAGSVGIVVAYLSIHHVADRINRFLNPDSGDTFQVDTAIESFVRGSWLGRGPGEGTVKRILPDSHTDFIFAVAAEEFGIVLCLVLVALFAVLVLRGLTHARREEDAFQRLAVAGLVALLGIQSCINMAVNLHLMPAKGMTLPFISYGGSSLLSLALATGMLLALTRKRPNQTANKGSITFGPIAREPAV